MAGGHCERGRVRGRGVCVVGGMHGRGACMVGGGGVVHGRRDGHCSGRYASYCNAFLFYVLFEIVENKKGTISMI